MTSTSTTHTTTTTAPSHAPITAQTLCARAWRFWRRISSPIAPSAIGLVYPASDSNACDMSEINQADRVSSGEQAVQGLVMIAVVIVRGK